MYAKNTMETAVGENIFLKMLNDPPLQRHKLETIIINGDAHKRKETIWVTSFGGHTEQHIGRQKHKNGHNSGPWASPKWSLIDKDQQARPYLGLKYKANTRQHFVEEKRQITNTWLFIAKHSGRVSQAQGRPWLL